MERRVAIIGAGISGLVACKYVLSKGYNVVIFESKSGLGGVWTKTVKTTKLQSQKQFYQFSDFPWPQSLITDFPDKDQVLDYIESYAEFFDLKKHIRFNQKVVNIEYNGVDDEEIEAWDMWGGTGEAFSTKGKWNVTVQNLHSSPSPSSSEVHQVEFVILCLGRFSDIPNIPDFRHGKGPEAFQGETIHAMDYMNMGYEKAADFVKGKNVTVVGFMKSAIDISAECSAVNGVKNPCTVLYKTAHWLMPDYQPWGVPLPRLYFTRFSEFLLHKPGQGFLLSLLATLLSPLKWTISKFVESYLKWKLPLAKYDVIPTHSFLKEISSCGLATVPEGFFEAVDKDSIVLKKGEKFEFCKQGVIVTGESQPVESDVVIFATGFRGEEKLRNIFVSSRFKQLIPGPISSTVPLYRQCVHPRIPQLAVIGFSESITNLHTSEMRSKWVAEFLDGTFKLPNIPEMEKDIKEWDKFMKRYSGDKYRRSCINTVHIWHNDQLCADMGLKIKRKKGYFAELFEPFGPLDYTL